MYFSETYHTYSLPGTHDTDDIEKVTESKVKGRPTAGIIVDIARGRFVFAIPPATAPCTTMHASHPPPSSLVRQRAVDLMLRDELTPRTRCLHRITMSSAVQFPELRLIQYDCGKSFQPRLFVFVPLL